MKKVVIAFDVDGTLRDNRVDDRVVANERIRTLLVVLASFKNTEIVVWSGGGELYARQVADKLGISQYVDTYTSKNLVGQTENGTYDFRPDIKPDIAIDDIQSCELGILNLICKEK